MDEPFRIIDVPDVEPPIMKLCWKQAPTMERCDRRAGHGGLHVWELSAEIKRLTILIPTKET